MNGKVKVFEVDPRILKMQKKDKIEKIFGSFPTTSRTFHWIWIWKDSGKSFWKVDIIDR